MPWSDKEKQRNYDRVWSKTNKDKRNAANNRWRHQQAERFREFKKTLKCARCPEADWVCLDFHHLDPAEKDEAVSKLAERVSWERLMEEVKKCIVLCANCHRKEHAH